MSDLFEEDTEEVLEVEESFDDLQVDDEGDPSDVGGLDARRRLESILEEKRLQEELDDFIDY
jgi:hypothetical protein